MHVLDDAEVERRTSGCDLATLDAAWRAANYLAVGQIYLLGNPLLRRPLEPEDVKPRLLGHWGTTPGLTLLYTHCNRLVRERGLEMLFVTGPGHGGPAVVAQTWLEGSWSEVHPEVQRDEEGMASLFRQFSFPGGISSHLAPEVPGSIHEGGELGYSLAHATGAVFDNPDLVAVCVVGDGEAETGPLATSWHSGRFLDPARDGDVLPVLHLNGWKIANPSLLARIDDDDLTAMLRGYGWEPYLVEGDDPEVVHRQLAATLDVAVDAVLDRRERARSGAGASPSGHRRPMVVLRTPKGWTGPDVVDDQPVEGTWRAHQIPLDGVRDDTDRRRRLEEWMRSYRPEELFDDDGAPSSRLRATFPVGDRRMGSSPHAHGRRTRDLDLPDVRDHAVPVETPGQDLVGPTRALGELLAEVVRRNPSTFRLFGPDETASNKLDGVYDVTDKTWTVGRQDVDEHLAPDGRVMEVLSEHLLQGWLEGYLLTGRHGVFTSYEAFVHIVDSMVNQHAKWLKSSAGLRWRTPVPSLTYLLTSHVWQQDHNGFSHQDPGFLDHVVNKKAEVVRVYLPPDGNCLLEVTDHCLRSRGYLNVVVAGKQPSPQWLDAEAARGHCDRGLGVWPWACTGDGPPDVVLACAGDVPTVETLAAADILRRELPDLGVRVVNVVDLMRLQPEEEHPHGLPDAEYDAIFTTDRPVVFAFHGYPSLVHRLTYRRTGHAHVHVRGYTEEGTTTTPFDMLVRNRLDRFHLVIDVLDRVPGLAGRAAVLRQRMVDTRTRHARHVREHGVDLPEVTDWVWSGS